MANFEVDESVLVKLAQKLAGNDKKYRDRAVKKLRRWLRNKSQSSKGSFTRKDFLKLWKGLHYCMWMSDKLLVQEELAKNIGSLLHALSTPKQVLTFVDVFFETECREWFSIDRLRLDKFMMLIRIMFRETLTYLKARKWKRSTIQLLTKYLAKTSISGQNDSVPDGIRFHVADIYLDEINLISEGQLSADRVQMFLEPYCVLLATVDSKPLQHQVMKTIFKTIIDWEIERANEEAIDEAMEATEDGEGEEEEEEEDEDEPPPRVTVDYKLLADQLFNLASGPICLSKNRKSIYNLVKRFKDLAEGIVPKGDSLEKIKRQDIKKAEINQAVHRMVQFEAKLEKTTKLGKRKQHEQAKRKRQQKMDRNNDKTDEEPKAKKSKSSHAQNHTKENGPAILPKPGVEKTLENSTTKSPKRRKKKGAPSGEAENIPAEGQSSSPLNSNNIEIENSSEPDLTDKVSHKKKKPKSLNSSVNTSLGFSTQDDSDLLGSVAPIQQGEISAGPVHKEQISSKNSEDLDSSISVQTPNSKKKSKAKHKDMANSDKSQKSVSKTKASNSVEKKKKGESVLFSGGFCSDSDEEVPTPKSSSKKSSKKTNSVSNPLVTFTKLSKTPPAFVNRALLKAKTPATEPRKSTAKLVEQKLPGSAPGSGKKVVFVMKKNQAQDFSDSLMVSPQLPFNPTQKPEQSILKASPLVKAQSPLVRSPRKKLFKQRNKASDFF